MSLVSMLSLRGRYALRLHRDRLLRQYATSNVEPGKDVTEFPLGESENSLQEDADAIELLRNKSRLGPKYYAKLHQKPPSLTEDEKQVFTLHRLRKLYGTYGAASGIDVGLLWPSKEELELERERERVSYPETISQMMEAVKQKEELKWQRTLERQNQIAAKMEKLEDWKKEVRDRVSKQKRLAEEAMAKKEKVMEEVRQMFGYRIDPKDEKFKDALLKKEQEEKKAAKAAKKLKKQQKLIEDIKKMAETEITKAKGEQSNKDTSSDATVSSPQSPMEPKL